jgi:1,5-anhydro-D-fructose reductase (1,5-anhydro-D-mannitol-forming)
MIRWGLAGCGDISNKRVAPAIKEQPDSILAAAVSPYADELEAFMKRHDVGRGYHDIDTMLANEAIDAVYVAEPVFLHHRTALKALRAGKHVLVEKPMALDNAQCEELINISVKNGTKLGTAYFRRFFPKLKDVKEMICGGTIGDVIQVRILYHSWYDPENSEGKNWRLVKSLSGGGPLWDMGCHKLDMLVDLLGMPVSVYGLMDTLTHGYEVEDSCSALLEMPNGAHCIASFNWNSRIWADEFVILGTNGEIIMDPCDSDRLTVRMNPRVIRGLGREETTISRPNHPNVHYPLIDDFARSIIENREPRISGAEAYKTNRILNAIERSAEAGRKVMI